MPELPMNKRQFDREQALRARRSVLQLLEASRATADPDYPIWAAGFWLREPGVFPVYYGA